MQFAVTGRAANARLERLTRLVFGRDIERSRLFVPVVIAPLQRQAHIFQIGVGEAQDSVDLRAEVEACFVFGHRLALVLYVEQVTE